MLRYERKQRLDNIKEAVGLLLMGSGTTAIACINTNRNYIGFELDKHYCEIANERIQKAMQDKGVGE